MKNTDIDSKVGWNLENTYGTLPNIFYHSQKPSTVTNPELIVLNHSLANDLGLDAKALMGEKGLAIFSGNQVPENSRPLAEAYAGHQFGHFTKLGDGRAILLGELIGPDNKRFDIQLKGSGRTPYSRGGDGKATLGPMIREYMISEGMHGLGIPTTRSLAVVTTGEKIRRETYLPGAVLTRVAASHIRVGTFQYAANFGTKDDLKALADYTLERHFPNSGEGNDYLHLLKEVVRRQATLIAKWQLVGFVHGVMNTDNMALSGETIDYGPCAFIDTYDPATVFSSIDTFGRYAFKNQPSIGLWNLTRFAETLLPLIHENPNQAAKLVKEVLADFSKLFLDHWLNGMKRKLGIFNEEEGDQVLIEELLEIMKKNRADYTNTFLGLTFDTFEDSKMCNTEDFKAWNSRWRERLKRQEESEDESHKLMKNHNPVLIPRNHIVEEVIQMAVEKGDYELMNEFLEALANPYAHTDKQKKFASLPEPSAHPYVTYCGT